MQESNHLSLVLPDTVENTIKAEDEKFVANGEHLNGESKEYVANTTIDKPPRFNGDDDHDPEDVNDKEKEAQQALPGIQQEVERLSANPHERRFKVEMVLKLTPLNEKSVNVPLCAGEFPSSRVCEVLALSLNSRRNKNIIEAVLDNPEPMIKTEVPMPDEVYGDVGTVSVSEPKEAEPLDKERAEPAVEVDPEIAADIALANEQAEEF